MAGALADLRWKDYNQETSMITLFVVIALVSAALGDSVATIGVPLTGLAAAPYVAPAVSTAVHHAPAVSEASRVTSFETTHPGVPHTVARVSSYTPAAVHTVHASVPAAVTGAVHVPGYTYLPRYSHRYDAHPLTYPYTYGATPYGVSYGQRLGTVGYVGYT